MHGTAAAVASTPADADAPTWRRRIAWCGLALVPAALLTAFTTHIATDIASAPLLWVLPLALYLSTFVLAFQSRLPLPMWLLAAGTARRRAVRAAGAGADQARQMGAHEPAPASRPSSSPPSSRIGRCT